MLIALTEPAGRPTRHVQHHCGWVEEVYMVTVYGWCEPGLGKESVEGWFEQAGKWLFGPALWTLLGGCMGRSIDIMEVLKASVDRSVRILAAI